MKIYLFINNFLGDIQITGKKKKQLPDILEWVKCILKKE